MILDCFIKNLNKIENSKIQNGSQNVDRKSNFVAMQINLQQILGNQIILIKF